MTLTPFSWHYRVRFNDVDAAGIVFYPNFFCLCHMAFEDFVTQKGPMPYAHLITKRGIGFPIVHTDATFMRPLFYGDTVEVSVLIQRIGTSSLKTSYEIRRNSEIEQCFKAIITTVCTDLATKKSTPFPKELKNFFEIYGEKN